MTFGTITRRIRTEIQFILDECSGLKSVWGFGSYFRGGAFNDVDLLAVVDCDRVELLAITRQVQKRFLELERELGMELHLLVLTSEEFLERPLRDMHQLNLLAVERPRCGDDADGKTSAFHPQSTASDR